MESQINWLITFMLTSLFWFWMYIRERRKRKAWQVIVNSIENRVRMLVNQYQHDLTKAEIDDMLDEIENP